MKSSAAVALSSTLVLRKSIYIVLSAVLLSATGRNAHAELMNEVRGLERFDRLNPFLRPIVRSNVGGFSDLNPKNLQFPLTSTWEQTVFEPLSYPVASKNDYITEKYTVPGMYNGMTVNAPLTDRLNTPLVSMGTPFTSYVNRPGFAVSTLDRFGNPLAIPVDRFGTPLIMPAASLGVPMSDSSSLGIDRFGNLTPITNRMSLPVTVRGLGIPLIRNVNTFSVPLVNRLGLPLGTTFADYFRPFSTTVERLSTPSSTVVGSLGTPFLTFDNLRKPVLNGVSRFDSPLNSLKPMDLPLYSPLSNFGNPLLGTSDHLFVPSTLSPLSMS